MIRRGALRTNLARKRTRAFFEEARPLLRPDVTYEPAAAMDWLEATFLPLLAGLTRGRPVAVKWR